MTSMDTLKWDSGPEGLHTNIVRVTYRVLRHFVHNGPTEYSAHLDEQNLSGKHHVGLGRFDSVEDAKQACERHHNGEKR